VVGQPNDGMPILASTRPRSSSSSSSPGHTFAKPVTVAFVLGTIAVGVLNGRSAPFDERTRQLGGLFRRR
jgi:hypothetical protein